ncbi:ATP-binding protein [Actinoallomurus sp. NPDC050550]|uniref:ATP-binding protein n=1 Tax=Actinoallomurus sp. NPDC050550 TaxID=3154937 RepID=UPI0033FAF273
MTEDIRICMPASAAAPGFTRRLMERSLKKWGYSDISYDAMLVATEIVTNAMRATPGEIIRFMCRWEDGVVYIAAWDSSLGRPAPTATVDLTLDDLDLAEAGLNTDGHRGLLIIDALALEWGYRPDPIDPSTGRSPGKWVWARVAATPSDHV